MNIFRTIASVPKGLKAFGREVNREYKARQIAAGLKAVEKQNVALAKMSDAQRATHEADNALILARAAELRATSVENISDQIRKGLD